VNRTQTTSLLFVAGALGLIAALLGIGFTLNAIGVDQYSTGRGTQIAGAIICLLVLIGMASWAVHLEHRLRSHTDVAKAYVQARSRPRSRSLRPRRKFGPVGTTVAGLIFLGGVAACVLGAISSHGQADRSDETQSAGIPVIARVENVDNSESCSKSSCSWTAAVATTLTKPVAGVTQSVIHVPRYSVFVAGDPVAVLVDPKQPSYAEIPGLKFKKSGEWIVLVCLAVFFLLLFALNTRTLVGLLAHRRAHNAAKTPRGPRTTGPKTVY
jgi:hypothetical protein